MLQENSRGGPIRTKGGGEKTTIHPRDASGAYNWFAESSWAVDDRAWDRRSSVADNNCQFCV